MNLPTWFTEVLQSLLFISAVATSLYYIPWLIRKGWIEGESASSKTKRICDTCFRDIKRVNAERRDHLNEQTYSDPSATKPRE